MISLDKFDLNDSGVEFSDAEELGLTQSDDASAYPLGLTVIHAERILQGGEYSWPVSGILFIMNMAGVRFSQILIGLNESYNRGLDGNGPALGPWMMLCSNEWKGPSLLNGWSSYGSGYTNPAYKKDAEGWVRLKGMMSGPTGTSVAFNLPAGYRPANHAIHIGVTNNSPVRVDAQSGGDVVVRGNSGWTSIDGITFPAEQ